MTRSAASPLRIPRNTKTLREMALETMREAILAGYFQPGDRLVERQLCDQLEVSRSIVREVLRHLETEGLVDTRGLQGPVVATVDAGQAAQIYEIRALLEGRAARACALSASDEELRRMQALNERTQEAFQRGDFNEVRLRTTAFYEAMFQACGMTVAWDIVQSLNARINRLRSLTISSQGRAGDVALEMEAIVSALLRRDPEAAEQASLAHVRRVAAIAAERLREESSQEG